MLRYRSSLAYNQLLIAHIESKIISVKFLPSVRPKNVPKLKILGIYWNLTHVLFRISWYWFGCQKLFSLNTYHLFGPNWSQNEKMLRIYWNLIHLIFLLQWSRFNVKIIFIKYCQITRPKFVPKLKMLRIYWNLASISYFKYINFGFKAKNKFYEIFTPKLAPKLKMLRVYWNLAYLILQICWFQFKCQKKWSIYHLLGPN